MRDLEIIKPQEVEMGYKEETDWNELNWHEEEFNPSVHNYIVLSTDLETGEEVISDKL